MKRFGSVEPPEKAAPEFVYKYIRLDQNAPSAALRNHASMTIPNQIAPHDHIVTARQIYRRFTLVVLTVEELVVLDRDVMRLVELDQVQTVIILERIV